VERDQGMLEDDKSLSAVGENRDGRQRGTGGTTNRTGTALPLLKHLFRAADYTFGLDSKPFTWFKSTQGSFSAVEATIRQFMDNECRQGGVLEPDLCFIWGHGKSSAQLADTRSSDERMGSSYLYILDRKRLEVLRDPKVILLDPNEVNPEDEANPADEANPEASPLARHFNIIVLRKRGLQYSAPVMLANAHAPDNKRNNRKLTSTHSTYGRQKDTGGTRRTRPRSFLQAPSSFDRSPY